MTIAAAYGLRIAGLQDTPWLAVDGADGAGEWPVLTIERRAELEENDIRVDVTALRAFVSAEAAEAAIVHPLLGRAALSLCDGVDRDAIHAGVIAGPAGAWGIVGARAAGKSTMVAACAEAGLDVLADDVLIIRSGRVLCGPRCLDLRHPPRSGQASTEIRRAYRESGELRYRLTLPPAPAQRPLAGIVHLEWGEQAELVPLSRNESWTRIFDRQVTELFPRSPALARTLAELPGHVLRRPRDLGQLAATVELLAELAVGG